MSDEDNKEKRRVIHVADVAEVMLKRYGVPRSEFQDIMWAFHDHLRQHNYGLLHRAIHDMLDHYELEQPPDAGTE